MRTKFFLIGILTVVLFGCGVKFSNSYFFNDEVVRKEFEKVFKKVKVLEVKESEVDGVWEVWYERDGGVDVIYYYPKKRYLIFGEIWDVNGTSLTGEKRVEKELKLLGGQK
ncbi:MAG: disulfide isomerase DsbC N-terminal domain-containing protein [Caldimicrobium sp.]|jgi:hypothetical protein